jgi:GNAT superfamily N-acetyltransferase
LQIRTLPAKRYILEVIEVDLDRIRSWCDMVPSWQNEVASVRRAREPFVALGNELGASIVFPSNGDVPMLAVDPSARRKGLGRRLLAATATRANVPLRILNIDDREEDLAAFLEACGAKRTVRQIEMVWSG